MMFIFLAGRIFFLVFLGYRDLVRAVHKHTRTQKKKEKIDANRV